MGMYTGVPALQIHQQDPIGEYAKLVALQNSQQQMQYQQQNQPYVQQGLQARAQLEESQADLLQQKSADNKAIIKAYNDAGGDMEKAIPLARQYGASPTGISDWQTAENSRLEGIQKLRGEELANAGRQATVLGQVSGALLQVPANQRAQAFPMFVPQLKAAGFDLQKLDPQSLSYLLQDENLKHFQISSLSTEQQIKNQQWNQEHGPLSPSQIQEANSIITQWWKTNNKGDVPESFLLGEGATVDDLKRKEPLIGHAESASATQAQREFNNSVRSAMLDLAKGNQQLKIAEFNKPTADEERRADLGRNMQENLTALKDIVNRRPDLFGPAAGWLTSARGAVGTNDPDIARLKAIKEYLGMASVGAHAMRNAQHVATAADAVMAGFRDTPKAMNAAIDAANNSVNTFLTDEANARSGARSGIPTPQGGPLKIKTPGVKQPPQSAGVLTQAQLEKAASDHGISVAEAKKQAELQGYTIK